MCAECLAEIQPTRAPQCVVCGDRLAVAALLMGDSQCAKCHECRPEFERAMSFGEYEGALRGLIHLLKYEGVRPAARPMGRMVAQTIAELLRGSVDSVPLLVPVPLHKSRRRARAFNQSELISRAAAKFLPQPLAVVSGALVRHRDTISQVGLSHAERIKNVRNAFRVAESSRLEGRDVMLVDDVMTTGTTLSECARVLKRAGAKRVWAATVARAFDSAVLSPQSDTREEEAIEADVAASV